MGAAGGAFRVSLSAFLFVLTGVIQTVCIQGVLYSGGGDRSTFLLAIPNYIGIFMVYFVGKRCFKMLDRFGVWSSGGIESNRVHHALYNASENKHGESLTFFGRLFHRDRRKLFVLAFNELGGFLSGITGLSIAGSGLYQVVFSGATVFTALLSTFFLRKRLSFLQWLFVGVITTGLMITAEQVAHTSTEAGAASLVSGVSFVLVSCLFYSTNYVIVEHFLCAEQQDVSEEQTNVLPPPSGLDLSLYSGGTCLVLFGIYVFTHTVPHWQELVTSSIERHHGNTTIIVEEYVYLAIASFVHAVTHFDVVATIGAVPIGVLNAIRAVSVFAVSSVLFCSHQASQCYNSRKGVSTAVVIVGAFGFSAASAVAVSGKAKKGGYGKVGQTSPRVAGRMLRRVVSSDMSRSMSFSFLDNYENSVERGRAIGRWFGFPRTERD